MSILCVILARGGSKGIPRKNLADLGGIPLVAHAIRNACALTMKADVVVSTDDREIAEVAIKYGAEVPFLRPAELAQDDVASLPAVQHAVRATEAAKGVSYDLVVYLQPTAPLCRIDDIEACITILQRDSRWESAVAITEAELHPFRLKRLLEDGRVINYIDQGFEDMRPRQILPPVHRRAGSIYASRREVVMNNGTLVGDPCAGIVVPPETALDIDTPFDLELARLIYARIISSGSAGDVTRTGGDGATSVGTGTGTGT